MRVLTILLIVFVGCKASSSKDKVPQISEPHEVLKIKSMSYSPFDTLCRYYGVAHITSRGKLIPQSSITFKNTVEYDEYKNLLASVVNSNGMTIKTRFNKKGQESGFESYNKGELTVKQTNTYNERDDIIEEYRIEIENEVIDTILYEYHYSYNSINKNHLTYRTNNKDTVARISATWSNSKETEIEETYPNRRNYVIITTETTFDQNERPIHIFKKSISQGVFSDTIIITKEYVYNLTGQLIEEKNDNDIFSPKSVSYKYENGMLKEKLINGHNKVVYEFHDLKESN
jgi:hypothetical protein